MKLNELVCVQGGVSQDFLAKLDRMTFVGIDFGTSTTTVTRLVYDGEQRQLVSAPLQVAQEDSSSVCSYDHLVPTVIAKVGEGRLIYGAGAKACLMDDETYAEGYNVWSEFKMHLGEKACYPHSQLSRMRTPDKDIVIEQPRDAAKHFFAYLRKAILDAVEKDGLPKDVRYAVTVPASFAPNQREELCGAIRDAGIELATAALLDEPNSAFLGAVAYYAEGGMDAQFFREGEDSRVLVFDFGAGTCDISLLNVAKDGKITNLAISHFTALGGRDIDERIVNEVLYPKLIAGRKEDELPVMNIRKNIVNKLRPVAEQLKIATCENFEGSFGERAFVMAANDPDSSVEARFSIRTKDFGSFENSALEMTAGEFAKIMSEFTEDSREAFEHKHKSIFDPIDEVLRKVGFSADDVDFVLMVGGSALNPFVHERIEERFKGVPVLNDADPRTLVSRGAAIHSFAVNGFGQSFVTPITSESIYIRTKSGPQCIIPAGATVPMPRKEIDGLYIDDESATNGRFGIPVYASADERELGIATFELLDIGRGCEVKLFCSIAEDKVIECEIEAAGKRFAQRFDMPESSENLSADELEYQRAVNDLNFTAVVNRGVPTVEQYRKVADVCMRIGKEETAAEYYRNLMYEHRNEHYEYEVARGYRDAGKKAEALHWIRRACEYRKSYLNVWYMIWDLQRVRGWDDPEVAKWLEYALTTWPDDDDLKFVDMRYKENTDQQEAARRIAEQLCEAWEDEGVEGLEECTLERFEIVARMIGRKDLVEECRKQLQLLRADKGAGSQSEDYTLLSSHALDKMKEGVEA